MNFSLSKDSGSSEDYNYEAMRLYEEIDSFREFPHATAALSHDLLSQSKNLHSTGGLPPSILRPPDISDIFLRFWNEDTCPEQASSLRYGSGAPEMTLTSKFSPTSPHAVLTNSGSSRSVIPRPKVGWPSRKVTFGKRCFMFSYHVIFDKCDNNLQICTIRYNISKSIDALIPLI